MNKIILLFIIAIATIYNVKAQVTKIDNKITEKHTEITGTKYSMIKPDSSFTISSNFTGFENKKLEAGININQVPLPFEQILQMISKDIPPENGKLVFEKDYIINGNKTKFYKTDVVHISAIENIADPESEGHAIIGLIMIYGNDSLSIIISGRYPSSKDAEFSEKFIKSFLSFIYDDDKTIDPMEGLSFNFDIDKSELKFASTILQTGAIFNLDGKFPSQSEDKTSYMVMIMQFPIEDKEEQRKLAIEVVKSPLRKSMEIKEVNEIEVNGIAGIEVVGYWQNKKGENELQYSASFYTPEKYYVIRANSTVAPEEKLKLFKEFTRTFKLK